VSTAQLAEDEFPARTALKGAQERLAAALAAGEAAAQSLARGRETLAELEGRQDAVKAEVANEARTRAEAVEQGVCAVIGGAAQKRREVEDELSSFEISLDILLRKNSDAQRAISECEAALAGAVKSVIAEEVSPLLCRLQDCENAAAMLRSELRALQFCGRFGLCPESLPARLAREPANVFHADRPLDWNKQKVFDRQKAAWCNFADRLREDANAMLSLGD
jgi:chromosome segregation ATPase